MPEQTFQLLAEVCFQTPLTISPLPVGAMGTTMEEEEVMLYLSLFLLPDKHVGLAWLPIASETVIYCKLLAFPTGMDRHGLSPS